MGKKPTKCENGHFYDAEIYAKCPHCESGFSVKKTVPDDSVNLKPTEPDISSSVRNAMNQKKQQQSSNDGAKTISFFSTQGVAPGNEPTVGLLLCVQGEDFGATYMLKAGKNFIGRAEDMDVVIANDKAVSRHRHAIVLYEPKGRIFIAQPGESRELFYVNEQVVLNAKQLCAYDEISLGNTKLVFVPICGEHFTWEDYKKD
jgi:hypothetical protein